jgi:hypothetical protein
MTSADEIADHILYRTYHALMMPDILHHLGFDATAKNKDILHKFHKHVLGYKSIAGLTQDQLSVFLFAVCVFWADRGIFVRTKRTQPWGIERMGFSDIIEVDGREKRVWDLL